MSQVAQRPCVLVFAGHDPSGGAGIQADIEAIARQGAHPLVIITALTIQDNDRVYAVHPVDAGLIVRQAEALMSKMAIAAIKIGIVGSHDNAEAIAHCVQQSLAINPAMPVVLDTVLGSGHGDALGRDDAVASLRPLLTLATLITPNLPEAQRLFLAHQGPRDHRDVQANQYQQDRHRWAQTLLQHRCTDVLIKGGHADGEQDVGYIRNSWFTRQSLHEWQWPTLAGEFHGSGCTLAAAIAGQLASGKTMSESLQRAQEFTQRSLENAYAIATGQRIPQRVAT
ncbi:bifunctional hydroxymethylpyrimidine kinase/phosphomethylpyrimidine kinase [Undibacterium sp. RuTC16W]|uniref:bifunctional hydroxymethylpyrimidine kinase/phosphomethylpyrimidine kinase n=1 Tax=Undibacterium sp. RuTC16W TaxID=3413048 RepID=UPI003BF2285A